eukprot:CAMPEP_0170366698 /NCGR_PEP_ID=MMETSP0117_2-20130122/6552_1 /TAXON_ID=400756 /ORGANISM="Durinskia baltica, Strain CSIRO CS-38" /LENGTH=100 /DNA_ID=CAMNT_0010621295 /DNA_START=156 /DNA_END=458 /DNA_ORIENTATION=-
MPILFLASVGRVLAPLHRLLRHVAKLSEVGLGLHAEIKLCGKGPLVRLVVDDREHALATVAEPPARVRPRLVVPADHRRVLLAPHCHGAGAAPVMIAVHA